MGQLEVRFRLGIGGAQVFSHTHLFMMLAQQLLADGVPVFGNDPDKPVDILRVISNEFGKFLHLRFEMFQAPPQALLIVGARLPP